MSVDIHVRVFKYEKDENLYKELKLYRKRSLDEKYEYDYKTGKRIEITSPLKEIYIDLGRNYDMFDGMKHGDKEDGYGYFPWVPIALNSLEPEAAEELKELISSECVFDFSEISLADMKNYIHDHPFVTDYDVNEEKWDEYEKLGLKPTKTNPIKYVIAEIENFINFADPDAWLNYPLSYYKIIFYFDC